MLAGPPRLGGSGPSIFQKGTMPIRRDAVGAAIGAAIIDETFQIRGQTLAIRVPVAEHLLADPAGRRAVADHIEDYVTGPARPAWASRVEMHDAVRDNATWRDLRGALPLGADGGIALRNNMIKTPQVQVDLDVRAERLRVQLTTEPVAPAIPAYAAGQWANANMRITPWDPPETEPILTRLGDLRLDDMVARVRQDIMREEAAVTEPDSCACGQRFHPDGEPNQAWEHGQDECVFVERSIGEFIDHGDA